jgi:AraC-like DNA-binding protein
VCQQTESPQTVMNLRSVRRTLFLVARHDSTRATILRRVRDLVDVVYHAESLDDISEGFQSGTVNVTLIAYDFGSLSELSSAIRRFRNESPAIPLLLCVEDSGIPRHLASLARAGLDALCLINDPTGGLSVRKAVARHLQHALPPNLVRSVLRPGTYRCRSYCAWCYRNGNANLSAQMLAHWFNEDPATVNRNLRADSFPSLHVLILLSRLLHIAQRLDSSDSSITAVAKSLNFPSQTALSMFVKRHTGRSPTELQRRGAVAIAGRVIADSWERAARVAGD